jgi:hypothetical protein
MGDNSIPPLGTIGLSGPVLPAIGYILARGFDGPFGQFYTKAGERRWWQAELACGHDMPNELTSLLVQRA